MSKCILYCGGILTCDGYTDLNQINNSDTKEKRMLTGYDDSGNPINPTNPTDATAFVYDFENGQLDVVHSCCSTKMTCKYSKSGNQDVMLFDSPTDIWREEYVDSNDNLVFSFFAKNNNNGDTEHFPIYAPEWFCGNGIDTVKYSFKNDSDTGNIPSATSINMFYECKDLVSCDVPCEMRCISDDTFHGCTSLTSYTTNPQFVEHIGERAFEDCTSLEEIVIGEYSDISTHSFMDCSGATTIKFRGVNANGDGKCNMNEIPSHAFHGCISLSSVTFVIGNFDIPDDEYEYDFLAIPNSITGISEYAFSDCSGFSYVQLGYRNDGSDTIGGIRIESPYDNSIGSGVTTIGDYAFNGCSSVSGCIIGSGIGSDATSIGSGAFGFDNLKSLVYNSAKAFSRDIFYYDSLDTMEKYLTTLKFGDAVTAITAGACSGFTALTTVEIGTGMQDIGANAFENCTSLTGITSYATTAPTITNSTFQGVSQTGTLYIPQGSTGYDDWENALGSGWTVSRMNN